MARQSKYSKRRVPGGRTYRRYPENLQTIGNKIFSYGTHVATYKPKSSAGRTANEQRWEVVTKGWWSSTTSKHINYIAGKWGAKVRKGK